MRHEKRLPIESGENDESGQAPVPAFGCIVYFSHQDGRFTGRTANLRGIEVSAAGQREMLGQIVARFKELVGESLRNGQTPDWIEPPLEKGEHEQKLFLPVHL